MGTCSSSSKRRLSKPYVRFTCSNSCSSSMSDTSPSTSIYRDDSSWSDELPEQLEYKEYREPLSCRASEVYSHLPELTLTFIHLNQNLEKLTGIVVSAKEGSESFKDEDRESRVSKMSVCSDINETNANVPSTLTLY